MVRLDIYGLFVRVVLSKAKQIARIGGSYRFDKIYNTCLLLMKTVTISIVIIYLFELYLFKG